METQTTANLRYFIDTSFSIFFGGGACPQTPYGTKNLFPHCMPVEFLGHADLPFFIPAELTALDISMTMSGNTQLNLLQCVFTYRLALCTIQHKSR